MGAALPVVEIPGYADAVRREDELRRRAWVNPWREICGVRVRPLTLRDMESLAELRNGFFLPWKFDSDEEYLGHCAQVVWWLSALPKPTEGDSWLRRRRVLRAKDALVRKLFADRARLAQEVPEFIGEQFFDSLRGSSGAVSGTPIAANPAYVADTLAAAGYRLHPDEVMALPLPQLWQLLRVATRRMTGQTPPNPSDKVATDYLAQLQQQKT